MDAVPSGREAKAGRRALLGSWRDRVQIPLSVTVLVAAFVVAGILWMVGAVLVSAGKIVLFNDGVRVALLLAAAGGLAFMTAALLLRSRLGWWWAVAWGVLALADGLAGLVVRLDRAMAGLLPSTFRWLEDGWVLSILIGLALLGILMRPSALSHYGIGRGQYVRLRAAG